MNLYFYRAKIRSVYDGDTVTADIDLGMNLWLHGEKLRLARIDTPELRGQERSAGLVARDYLRGLILDKEVMIETTKDRRGKYGRYLADIWLKDEQDQLINVNDLLIANGYAQIYGEKSQTTEPA